MSTPQHYINKVCCFFCDYSWEQSFWIRVYFKRGGTPQSNEISAKTRNVGPLKYTLVWMDRACSTKCVLFGAIQVVFCSPM